MRIAFFGGTFDPPHLGHLRIALAAADSLALDRVLFAPVALQPLKRHADSQPRASFADRLAMLQLLLDQARDPRLALSTLDAPHPDGRPNYTYDTLLRLRATLAPEDSLFLLTGADSLRTLPQWHRASELIHAADFIVAARPGFPVTELTAGLTNPLLALAPAGTLHRGPWTSSHRKPGLKPESGHPVRPSPAPESESPTTEHKAIEHMVLVAAPAEAKIDPPSASAHPPHPSPREANFYLLLNLDEDISSTAIRASLAANPHADPLDLDPAVVTYIRQHGLYR